MNTRQCTRSVYAYDWSSIFLKSLFCCDVSVFLWFSNRYRNQSFSSFLSLNQLFTSDPLPLQAYCHQFPRFTLPLQMLAGFSRETFDETHMLYYMVTNYSMLDGFRTQTYFQYFHRLSLNFLMHRPTCVSASMILSLSFLFATCGCFRRNEEIGGP